MKIITLLPGETEEALRNSFTPSINLSLCKGLVATWIPFPSCFLESNLGKFLAARFCENFLYLQINYSLFLQYMPSICLHNCKGIYFWQVIRSLCSMVMPNSCLYPTLFTALTLARSCSYESLCAPLNLITLYPDIQHSPCLTQPCSKGCVRSIPVSQLLISSVLSWVTGFVLCEVQCWFCLFIAIRFTNFIRSCLQTNFQVLFDSITPSGCALGANI